MSPWEYLDADTVIEINRVHGGPGAGVRSLGGVEAAVARAWSGFAGIEVYPTLWLKAASLLHGFARTQYFVDGNKRTAWLAAVTFLRVNGEDLMRVDVDEAERFVLDVVAGRLDEQQVARWLLEHARPLVEDLGGQGTCVLCGRDGDLPGAELMHRQYLRWLSVRTDGDVVQEWGVQGLTEYGARMWRVEHDLVPDVCRSCRDGWLSLLGKRFNTVMQPINGGEPPPRLATVAAGFAAAWLVRGALMRAVLDPFVPRWWVTAQCQRLRQNSRVPHGWSVWVALLADDRSFFSAGRLTTSSPGQGEIGFMQHTWSVGPLASVEFFDPGQTGLGDILVASEESRLGVTLHRLWPPTPDAPSLSLTTVPVSMLGELEGMLRRSSDLS